MLSLDFILQLCPESGSASGWGSSDNSNKNGRFNAQCSTVCVVFHFEFAIAYRAATFPFLIIVHAEDSAWERKGASSQKPSWGAVAIDDKAVANTDQPEENADCWNKAAVKGTGSGGGASASWGKPADEAQEKSAPWDKGKNVVGNSSGSWGNATTEKSQADSSGKSKCTFDGKATVT